jgi:hypothetical protein
VWKVARHADLARLVEVMYCVVTVSRHGHGENNRLLVNVVKMKYWETSLTDQSRRNEERIKFEEKIQLRFYNKEAREDLSMN